MPKSGSVAELSRNLARGEQLELILKPVIGKLGCSFVVFPSLGNLWPKPEAA